MNPSWKAWVERETSKRLVMASMRRTIFNLSLEAKGICRILYGIFVLSSLITVTFSFPPGIALAQDLDLELPDDERMWEAASEQQWRQLMGTHTSHSLPGINDALAHLVFGKVLDPSVDDQSRWSAFSTIIVMHAVNNHMWHLMQCTHSFTLFAVDPKIDEVLRSLTTAQTETALARCHSLLTTGHPERERTSEDPEGPMIFNCLALLRISYVRAFTATNSFNRIVLLTDDKAEIMSAMKSYVLCKQSRSVPLTKAVSRAFEALLMPIKSGHLLVRKTAAFSWSIEHAIAGWDCGMIKLLTPCLGFIRTEPFSDSSLLHQMAAHHRDTRGRCST